MQTAQTFTELFLQLKTRFLPFCVVFFAVTFVTYLVLYVVDFYPEPATETTEKPDTLQASDEVAPGLATNAEEASQVEVITPTVSALPVSITFDALDKTVTVLNPTSAAYEDLDTALARGVVRHPQSADFENTGNMLILGHSSYLPTVNNKNFQAFNGIQKLAWGDTIRVASEDTEYVYRVDRVYQAPASDIYVPVGEDNTAKLTLATCNVFGAKEDRHIVEATLISKVALGE